MNYARSARSGFSLIEIMIAVAIMAILAAVAVPTFLNYLEQSKESSTKSNLAVINGGIKSYYLQIGQYPSKLNDLVEKPKDEDAAAKWRIPFIENEIPLDGWGNKFQYKVTPEGAHGYELYSFGSKGKNAAKNERIDVWARSGKKKK
jgi:general secretion pathway protein G